jgi:hypothetical protein
MPLLPYLITLDLTVRATSQDDAEDLARGLANQVQAANTEVVVAAVVQTTRK